MLSLLLASILACNKIAVVGSEVTLHSANDLVQFSNNVNKGTDYAGTTVFLDSDIDLAGIDFKVIGTYTTRFDMRYFAGVFDAQGHTISNLKIKKRVLHRFPWQILCWTLWTF